jgi:hypothetical protein
MVNSMCCDLHGAVPQGHIKHEEITTYTWGSRRGWGHVWAGRPVTVLLIHFVRLTVRG